MTGVEPPAPRRASATASLPPPPEGWEQAGAGIVRASLVGTAVFTVASAAGAIAPGLFRYVAATVSLVLFALGLGIFAWSYAVAVGRSRADEIGIGGLYFLAGPTAPASVRRRLMGLFGVQIVVGLTAAAVRPFTPLAFGTLVPVYGLALAGLWGALYGRFGPRVAPVRSARAAAREAARATAAAPAGARARAEGRGGRAARAGTVRARGAGADQNASPSARRRRSEPRPRPRTSGEEAEGHGRTGDAADHR